MALSERSEDIRHRIRERPEGFPLLAVTLSLSLTTPNLFHTHSILSRLFTRTSRENDHHENDRMTPSLYSMVEAGPPLHVSPPP